MGDVTEPAEEGGRGELGAEGGAWNACPPASPVPIHGAHGVQLGSGNTQNNIFRSGAQVAWPVVVGRAPLTADAFQERPDLAGEVRHAPAEESAVITRVVAGDGGTGKTQLAASLFRQSLRRLDVAVWVQASSRSAILSAYAQAWARLHPEQETGCDAEADAAAFACWLEVTNRSWMVVLDDVQDPADVRGLWPIGPTGRVLLTTRRRDPALTGHGRQVVEVGAFTDKEANSFLRRKLGDSPLPDVLNEAGELAEDLGRLPLALAQAGAVILDEGLTCGQYRAWFADRTRRLADLFTDPGDEYERTVATTWSLSIDLANAMPPVGLARHVLRLAAVLDPNGAPEALFTQPAALAYLSDTPRAAGSRHAQADEGTTRDDATDLASADEVRRALRNLHRLSLVAHDPVDRWRTVRMHALAQRTTLENLADAAPAIPAPTSAALTNLVRAAADALTAIWPDADPAGDAWAALRANAQTLTHRHPDVLCEPVVHEVQFRVGRSLGDSGQIKAAIRHYADLAGQAEARLGPDHPDTLTARGNLACWRGEAGDVASAITALEQLLTDQLRVLGPDHPSTLTTRHNLADHQSQIEHPAKSTAYEQLLTDQLQVLGPDHPDTLTTRAHLALCQGEAGNPAGAVADLQQLLTHQLRLLGAEHPNTLTTRNNIAFWRGEAGDPAGAVAATQELLTDQLRILGPDHKTSMLTRRNLAHWRGRAGNPTGAAAAYQQLLTDQLRVLGPDHPQTLITRHNLAYWWGKAGNPAGAAAAYEQLLTDQLRVMGTDHPLTLTIRHGVVYWRGEAGDPVEAAAAYEQLVADRLRVLGPAHPHTLMSRHGLAHWRGRAGNPAAAVTELQRLLTDQLRVLGPDHPNTLTTRFSLADYRGEAGDPSAAVTEMKRLLTDQLRVLGPDHPDTLTTRHNLAHWRDQGVADDVTQRRPGAAK